MKKKIIVFSVLLFSLSCCDKHETGNKPLHLLQAFVGNVNINLGIAITDGLPVDSRITLVFSGPLNQTAATSAIELTTDRQRVDANISFLSEGRTLVLYPARPLASNTLYILVLSGALQGSKGEPFTPLELSFKTSPGGLKIIAADIEGKNIMESSRVTGIPLNLGLTLHFSVPVNTSSLEGAASISGPGAPGLVFSFSDNNRTVEITSSNPLKHLSKYQIRLSQALKGEANESFTGFSKVVYTAVDETPKMPVVSDAELLTIIQQQTFKYFWDFAHPASGMARERDSSGDIVTTGGSGFGVMAILVGIERNFISRADGLARLDKILVFLETADRFHGAWPHWLNGITGKVHPFSTNDNGGDLVETSFLIQGLLTFRQYLDPNVPGEKSLAERINSLWKTVEWDWYTQRGQDVLYWHWSPDKQWIMNHPIRGYNEALITYFLAAASPTHSIEASVYNKGWAANGGIINNRSFYGITLPLGYDYGGPLFFAHYSFLGLDPRNLQDVYANYWTQNVNHSRINHAYAVANPKNFVGYSDENWGLTASDDQNGYAAHSPTNDLGVITPTAALSSMPYTPEESMKALKFFYYTLGDRLWGTYGFYDAFNITEDWTANSYLAIDQGPIIVMIENYRTGLLWDLFMSAPEVQDAMDKLGFTR